MRERCLSLLREKLKEILARVNSLDLLDDLVSVLEDLVRSYRPLSIIVAGSLARGSFIRGLSDIDVLVIVGYSVDKFSRFLLRAVDEVDVEITVFSLEEVIECIERGNEFVIDALVHGCEVYGNLRSVLLRYVKR